MAGKYADQIQTQLFLASDFNQTDTVSGMSRCIVQFVLVFTLVIGVLQSHATIDATLQMQLGNPSGATAGTNNQATTSFSAPSRLWITTTAVDNRIGRVGI